MLWFVNPLNPYKAVNLTVCGSLNLKKTNIYIDNHVWSFETNDEAKAVYEEMIKLVQQSRYRVKEK